MKWFSAVALAVLASGSAQAADLGGNCCADLEERVAELEATVARKGNRKVSVTVYGQVNAAIGWYDAKDTTSANIHLYDGNDTLDIPWGVVVTDSNAKGVFDNSVSESRFGFMGEAQINESIKAGFVVEIGVGEPGEWGTGREVTVRKSAWFLDSKQLGRVTMGKYSQATDDIDTISLANIGAVVKMLSAEPVSSGIFGEDLPYDGGKKNLVRYDTPSIGGFVASASWTGEDTWDVALRYAGEFGQFRVAGGAGYRRGADGDRLILSDKTATTWLVNAGVMHVPSGIFIQGAYGDADGGLASDVGFFPTGGVPDFAHDTKAWHVLGGIEQKAFSVGKTTFFAEYGKSDADFGRSYECVAAGVTCFTDVDESLKWWGVGIVQAIDAAAMDLYISYRQYDADSHSSIGITDGVEGGELHVNSDADAKVIYGGARIKF